MELQMGVGKHTKQTHKQITTVNNYNKCHEEKGAVRKRTLGRAVVVMEGEGAGKALWEVTF